MYSIIVTPDTLRTRPSQRRRSDGGTDSMLTGRVAKLHLDLGIRKRKALVPECGNQLEPMMACSASVPISSGVKCTLGDRPTPVRLTGEELRGYSNVFVVVVVNDGVWCKDGRQCCAICMIHDGLARWRRGGEKRWNATARWVQLSVF